MYRFPIWCKQVGWRLCAVLFAGGWLLAPGGSPGYAADAPGVTLPRQNLSTFTPAQWTAVFQLAQHLPLGQRTAFWADLAAVGSTYVGDPLGEGPGSKPDADPLSDFAHVDCVTYIEQVYALALSPERQAFDDTLRRIRYRDGQIDYRWRNHYTVSDWLPANAWFIHDITGEIAGDAAKTMTKTISRGKFFAGKGLPQYADLPDEECTTAYIPRDALPAVAGKLKTGDMIIFVISTPGIIAGHTGLLHVENGTVKVQHASLTAKAVVTVPLADYLRTAPARFVGFKIARPVEPKAAAPEGS